MFRVDVFFEGSERIMRRPAGLLLAQAGLDASTSQPFTLLDHACGTGLIAAHLQATLDKQVLSQSKMTCADISVGFVEALKRRVSAHGWVNVETSILDAQKTDLSDLSFLHVTMNFAMHLIPDPGAALQDIARVLQPGGTFAFTTLPFEAPMPNPLPMAPNGKSEFIDPDLISEQLRRYGFEGVKVQTMEHIMRIENAEDFLRSFGMMKDWMLEAFWSEESKAKVKGMLGDHILRHLTEKHNGQGWDLTWTFIVATCQKPRN
ncbi:S-adenosyl-L-methionine-dependent methyltransferase [Nemania sp. NC0429]|nr:S-adenosyl-L-methionine-dependent methyltransferase [Nemania sp. NC0429]